MARKRKMSALQRRYFGRRARRVARAAPRALRRYRRSVGSRSWLPLTGREHLSAAITGAATPVVMGYVRPYSDQWLGFLGDYKDEGATYIVGAVAHKFLPGIGKDVGKDMARLAVMSAAGQFTAGMLGNGTTAGNGGYL